MITQVEMKKADATLRVCNELISLQTEECLQFIDMTDSVRELVQKSEIRSGLVNIQTRHTTTGIMITESEPLLIEDLKRTLQAVAPHDVAYLHNDFTIRTINMCTDERKNGHSHCKAIFLKTSEAVNIVDGVMQLGTWQRIFFIELDRPRQRTVSVIIMGQSE